MAFPSRALKKLYDQNGQIGVSELFWSGEVKIGWALFRALRTTIILAKFLFIFYFYFYFLSWLLIRGVAKLLSCCGCGDGTFASFAPLRAYIMFQFARRSMGTHKKTQSFWNLYFLFAQSLETFAADYSEAWHIQPGSTKELIMFVDNDHRLLIPCSGDVDDKQLMKQLRSFYDIVLAKGGMGGILGIRESTRIDVVELQNDFAVGIRLKFPLNLGNYGPYNRQIHYFHNPTKLKDHAIRERLLTDSVMVDANHQSPPPRRALNVVRAWNPRAATILVLIPFVLGTVISVAWSIVAVRKFHADVQTSTQTGFTIGSYVVTSGALLIALIVFLDSKSSSKD